MLRVSQMAIANLLFKVEKMPKVSVLPLFLDNSALPFSIQSLTAESAILYPNKK